MSKRITNNEIKKIIHLSETMSQKAIAEQFNRSQVGIGQILKNNGVIKLKKSRLNLSKISLNIDFFKLIDTPEKAYWLGFICADGSINKTNSKLHLISKDLEVCQKFQKAIKSDHKISEIHNFDKRTNKTYNAYCIQITNELFVNNLINLGVSNKKTDTLNFPNIDEKYYSFFIAGLFDGDGSINFTKKEQCRISLISTKEVLLFIQKLLIEKFNVSETKFSKISTNKNNVYKLNIQNNKDVKVFLQFAYNLDFDFYLRRKLILAKKFIESYVPKIKKSKVVKEKIKYIPSQETKQKIGIAQKKLYGCGYKNPCCKTISQFDLNGVFIREWESISFAAKALNCSRTAIKNCVNGLSKKSNGFIWKTKI